MKNLIMIFALFVAVSFNVRATQNEMLRDTSAGLKVIHYKVKGNPQLNALQSTTENKMMVSGGISCTLIGDNIFYNDISLRSDMLPENLKQSLSKLWEVDVSSIYYFEDVISKRVYF